MGEGIYQPKVRAETPILHDANKYAKFNSFVIVCFQFYSSRFQCFTSARNNS